MLQIINVYYDLIYYNNLYLMYHYDIDNLYHSLIINFLLINNNKYTTNSFR